MVATGNSPDNNDSGHDETSKMVIVMNAALVGIPVSYTVSGSIPVTGIAAAVAAIVGIAYLIRNRC